MKKEVSAKVVELKSKNKELEDRNAELIKESAMQSSQADSLKKELATSNAENLVAKAELESTLNKMKFIAIDSILHARAQLMRILRLANMLLGSRSKVLDMEE